MPFGWSKPRELHFAVLVLSRPWMFRQGASYWKDGAKDSLDNFNLVYVLEQHFVYPKAETARRWLQDGKLRFTIVETDEETHDQVRVFKIASELAFKSGMSAAEQMKTTFTVLHARYGHNHIAICAVGDLDTRPSNASVAKFA